MIRGSKIAENDGIENEKWDITQDHRHTSESDPISSINKSICNNFCLSRMILNSQIIILNEL
jgi:hypothetical protein